MLSRIPFLLSYIGTVVYKLGEVVCIYWCIILCINLLFILLSFMASLYQCEPDMVGAFVDGPRGMFT